MDETTPQQQLTSLTDWLRIHTGHISGALGTALHRAGVHPDWVSLAGFGMVVGGAALLANGQLVLAGWLICLSGLFDALDGAVARARGIRNPFGAVLDSVLDRYADGFIFAGFGYYFASSDQTSLFVVALLALVGSYTVSYARSRAANPDVRLTVKVGWFSRFERLALVVWGLWLHPWLLAPALWVLAVGTNLTALQRLLYIRKHIED
jgi:CDP-diacylglycerol---glycerol-3-phosphate 3-phosphatidyltransferase